MKQNFSSRSWIDETIRLLTRSWTNERNLCYV